MATTTARRSTHPMSYYRNMVKNMDDSQKLELVSFIIDSMRSAKTDDLSMEEMLEGYPYKRYTKAEMNAMLDKAEANFEGTIWKKNRLSKNRSLKWLKRYESGLGPRRKES